MDTNRIGSKIAEARKNKNMSQAQMGQLLFISAQAVGKWERGESFPDIVMLNRLAEVLGVDLNYFSENFHSVTTDDKNDPGQTVPETNNDMRSPGRELLTNFSGSELSATDFAGVIAHKRRFNGSALQAADFSGADLTGSTFSGSNVREANFNKANLTDCILSANDLGGASFNQTILVRTEISKSNLGLAKFSDAQLTGAKLNYIDLRKAAFENCTFTGTDFKYSDLRGLCFDGQTFTDVKFDKTALNDTTFKGATLQSVSFRPTYALTNKYYRAIGTIRFEGATMDKLTYAALKGMGADLSGVTLI